MALLRPARDCPGASVEAVAARDASRARAFAHRHGIARVHSDYAALIDDPGLDAIYNPLPNALHAEWTIRALRAGKHVLCEKPLASNADEAERMAEAAEQSGLVLMEAFHWRYHPLAERMREIAQGGALGKTSHVEARFCIPLLLPRDIRWRYDLGGGATMDVGCYAIHIVRTLADAEPVVVSARAWLSSPGVDRRMEAELRFPDGRTGHVTASLLSRTLLRAEARVRGETAEMAVTNPVAPHLFHRLRRRGAGGPTSETVAGRSTYAHQLDAFVAAVREGRPFPTHPRDAVANMRVIDAVYDAAGLPRRGL
jgi:predicted dehydrogenase